jgi:hypothetical protein
MALPRSVSLPGRGPVYDYVAQLLASLQEVERTCHEDATARSKVYEERIPEMFEAPELADPFSVEVPATSPLRSCLFVSRESSKLSEIIRRFKVALSKESACSLEPNPAVSLRAGEVHSNRSSHLTVSEQQAKVEAQVQEESNAQLIEKHVSPRKGSPRKGSPRKGRDAWGSPRKAGRENRENGSPNKAQKENRSPQKVPKKLFAADSALQPTAIPPFKSTCTPLRAVQEACSKPAPSQGSLLRVPSPKAKGVKELMRKFEAQKQQAIPAKTANALPGKFVSSIGQAAPREAPALVSASPYLKEPVAPTVPSAQSTQNSAPAAAQVEKAAEAPSVVVACSESAPVVAAKPKGASRSRMRSGCLILPEDAVSAPADAAEPLPEPEAAAPISAAKEIAESDVAVSAVPEVAEAPAPPIEEATAPRLEEVAKPPSASDEAAAQVKSEEPVASKTTSRPLLSPKRDEDNYEISEKDENSDAEDEPDRKHKHVPRWCSSYLEVLNAQSSWDPDTVFGGKVPPCDLELIFTAETYKAAGKERPNRRRGSSQDWKKDGLRDKEVQQYKKKMGQTKPCVVASKSPLGVRNANVA